MGRASKGSKFERDICRRLGLWWTDGEHDDVFWRTSQSGGRATSRAKAGKKVSAGAGDISSVDGRGLFLTKRITFELKRGYPKASLSDAFDALPNQKKPFMEFVEQAEAAAVRNQTPWWILIHQRDRRQITVTFETDLLLALFQESEWEVRACLVFPSLTIIHRDRQLTQVIFSEFFSKEIKPYFRRIRKHPAKATR